MNALKLLTAMALVMTTSWAFATTGPSVDELNVQGYLAASGGGPIADGSYSMSFVICQNQVAVWGKTFTSVPVSGGLFNQQLITATGTDFTSASPAIPVTIGNPGCTGAWANWTGVTFGPAVLTGSTSGEVSVRVYAVGISGVGTSSQFDIPVSAVPTAFVAQTAYALPNGTLTIPMISAAATTTTSAGGPGLIPLTSTAGQFDATLIPDISAAKITSGTLAIAQGGTGAGSGAAALTSLGAAASGTNLDINSLNPSGGTLSVGGTNVTVLNILPTGSNAAIDMATNGTGLLTVGGAGTGDATFGNTGAGSVTDLTGPTVDVGDATTTFVNVSPTGANARITMATNGTGLLAVGGAGTGNATFGNFGGASETIIESGTGNVAIAGATELILPTAAFSVTQGAGATGALTLATTSNQNLTFAPNGTGLVNITSGAGLTGNAASFTGSLSVGTTSGSINLGSVGNGVITISQPVTGSAWTMTLPGGAGNAGAVLTTDGSGNLSWTGGTADTSTSSSTYGNTGTGSVTTIQSGTGGIAVDPGAGNAVTVGDSGASSTTTLESPVVDLGGASATTTIATQSTGLTTLNLGGTSTSVLTTTVGGTTTTSQTIVESGTGGMFLTSSGTSTTAVDLSVSGTNGGIKLGTNGTGQVTVGNATTSSIVSTGTTPLQLTSANTTGSSVDILVSGTNGGITLATNGTGQTTVGNATTSSIVSTGTTPLQLTSANTTGSSVDVLVSGVNGGITLGTNGTGQITVGNATTASIQSASTTPLMLSSANTSASSIDLAVSGVNGGITLATNGTGSISLNTASGGKIFVGNQAINSSVGFSAMGICKTSITAAPTTTGAFTACAGVPAGSTIYVACQPGNPLNAAAPFNVASSLGPMWFSAGRGPGSVGIYAGNIGTWAATIAWNCQWMEP